MRCELHFSATKSQNRMQCRGRERERERNRNGMGEPLGLVSGWTFMKCSCKQIERNDDDDDLIIICSAAVTNGNANNNNYHKIIENAVLVLVGYFEVNRSFNFESRLAKYMLCLSSVNDDCIHWWGATMWFEMEIKIRCAMNCNAAFLTFKSFSFCEIAKSLNWVSNFSWITHNFPWKVFF